MKIDEGHFVKIGELTPIEFSSIPFIPQRMFYVMDADKNKKRGFHSHRICEQFLICVKGAIRVWLYDGRGASAEITLAENECIHLKPGIWAEQRYLTGNDVLLVLCSHEYDEKDYIRDWNEFVQSKNK